MTRLPNEAALKMDGAQRVSDAQSVCWLENAQSKRARRTWKSGGVNLDGTFCGADLGGSSKYSNENFED